MLFRAKKQLLALFSRRSSKRRSYLPSLETLEPRCLLSVGTPTVSLGTGGVTITATNGEDLVISDDGNNHLTYEVDGNTNTLMTINASAIRTLVINCSSSSSTANNNVVLNLDDTVFSVLTSARVLAGGGTDTVDAQGSDVVVSVDGGSGADLIAGSNATGRDTLLGNTGNDTVLGLAGDDSIRGGGDNDVLIGGSGNDEIYGGNNSSSASGNDTISGESGDDTCFGEDGNDKISGGEDDDVVNGQAGNDSLTGDGGNDFVYGGAGLDSLSGGEGLDMVKGQGGVDRIEGTRDEAKDEVDALRVLRTMSGLNTGVLDPRDTAAEFQSDFLFDLSFVPDPDTFLALLSGTP